MKKSTLVAFLLMIAMVPMGPAYGATAVPKVLVIQSTEVDYAIGSMRIKGTNFGPVAPTVVFNNVTLSGVILLSADPAASDLKATIPAGTPPGSFLVTITNNVDKITGSFDSTVGAVGPQGAKGATGSTGPQGPQGQPGFVTLPYSGSGAATSDRTAILTLTNTSGTGGAIIGDSRPGRNGNGVYGLGWFGVVGRSFQSDGVGVRGDASGTVDGAPSGDRGVEGLGGHYGVFGRGDVGVFGESATSYGVAASGALAPLRLQPSATPGAPTSGGHQAGELYVDAPGKLWYFNGTAWSEGRGPEGAVGPQGAKGDTGAQGLKGDTGLQGTKGDQGAQGFVTLPYSGSGAATSDRTAILTLTNTSGTGGAIIGDSRPGRNGNGVYGLGWFGVVGRSFQSDGVGVRGDASGTVDGAPSGDRGVEGLGGHYGVFGRGDVGVFGESATSYGVAASGALAPLRLQPSATPGAPTSGGHQAGELYVDATGALWYFDGTKWTNGTGPQGPRGDKGDAGVVGAPGPKGDTGLPGAQGLAGAPGATGPKGDTGASGLAFGDSKNTNASLSGSTVQLYSGTVSVAEGERLFVTGTIHFHVSTGNVYSVTVEVDGTVVGAPSYFWHNDANGMQAGPTLPLAHISGPLSAGSHSVTVTGHAPVSTNWYDRNVTVLVTR